MALTPEEEKLLREQIRSDLEKRERRTSERKQDAEQGRQKKLEERLRERIKEEEEEQFFSTRGLVKYLNRYGEAEWLPPEEAERRRGRRSGKRSSSRRKVRKRKQILQGGLTVLAIFAALVFFIFLLRYDPSPSARFGSIVVSSNVPGAQVFLNGLEKPIFTPDTLIELPAGKNYYLSLFKDGFTTWPPMQRVDVLKGKTVSAEFELKHSAQMGRVNIDAELEGATIYVDGLPQKINGQSIEIPAGYHVVTVVRKGYVAIPAYQRLIVPADGTTDISFRFEKDQELGYLKVAANVSSAYVYLDNKQTGLRANGELLPVRAGTYQVRVRQNGYTASPASQLTTIVAGEQMDIEFFMEKSVITDSLAIRTETPGAAIIVDGWLIPHVTPMLALMLTRGDHFINFMRDDQSYSNQDLHVDLGNNDEVISLDVSF